MKLKRETRRHIEAEVLDYRETLKAIEELRAEIIHGRKREELGLAAGGGYESSITERRATKLADHVLLREMERITDAIRKAYENASDECREILFVKYRLRINYYPDEQLLYTLANKHQDLSVGEMCEILHIDESTFHRYHSAFIYSVAEKLGWW